MRMRSGLFAEAVMDEGVEVEVAPRIVEVEASGAKEDEAEASNVQ